jgi:hypothetical protein
VLLPIEGNNIIIGNVRIRQLRVKAVAVGNSGCHIPDMVRALLLSFHPCAAFDRFCHPPFQIQKLGNVKCFFDYSESNEETAFLSDVYNNFKSNNGREPDASEMSWMNFTKHTVSARRHFAYFVILICFANLF